jgi:hypothetical protein
MPAPKGHPLWGNPLKPKKLTPEELWEGAVNYFQWCNDNPWIKKDWVGKDAMEVDREVQRPYSISGLCIFLNISDDTFQNYCKVEGYETYFGICAHIKKTIDTQHFEGGMVGAFNANIVTRKLGLAEKQEIETNGNQPQINIQIDSKDIILQ